jgi:ABC-type polysaccharide/polyol phosphate export permease
MNSTADAASQNVVRTRERASAAERVAGPRLEIRFRRRIRYGEALRELWAARELIRTLAERDLRARYKQTLLGVAWAVVTPLMLMGVFTIVFTRFTNLNSHGAPYVLFAYLGLVPWTFFSTALSAGGMSLVANLSIVNKVCCPREVFPIATLVVALVDAAISTFVLAVIFGITRTAPKAEIVYVPVLLPVLFAFTLGAMLLASSLLVYLRDLRHALPLLIQLGLFVTPVAYGIEVLAHTRSKVLIYSAVNPLAPVIDGLRGAVLFGHAPDWPPLGLAAATSSLVLVAGYWLFKKLETGIADIA